MVEPVTVFLVAIACLLAAAAAVRPLAQRTGVPEAVWLIGLGVVLRASGLVSSATIAALAPFFAAFALVIVLFEAGRDMAFGAGGEQVGRARKLALVGVGLAVPAVMLFSQALSGLALLPVWSWTHALMLAALVLATAPEVFAPPLYERAHPGVVATLEREAALTGSLAIAATAVCIDLLSLQVPAGKAYAAIAAGFGLGLAFGAFAGLLWITAIRRIGPARGVYPYTLAAILGLYVVTDTLGGIGALAVLVFGAVVANAGTLVATIFRPRGSSTTAESSDEDFRGALDDHGRTVEITRVLLLTFVGLGLGPPWGLLAMGVILGLLLVVIRLLAVRLVVRGVDEREFSAHALAWPRGMLVAGLAALPHAAVVPGTESLTTLVFSAAATTCVAFAIAVAHGHQAGASDTAKRTGPLGQGTSGSMVGSGTIAVAVVSPPRPGPGPASTVEDLLGPGRAVVRPPGRTEVVAPDAASVVVPGRAEIPVAAPAEVPAPVGLGFARRTEIASPPAAGGPPIVGSPSDVAAPGGFSTGPAVAASPVTVIPGEAPAPAGGGSFSVRTEVAAPAAPAPSEAVTSGGSFSVRTEVAPAPTGATDGTGSDMSSRTGAEPAIAAAPVASGGFGTALTPLDVRPPASGGFVTAPTPLDVRPPASSGFVTAPTPLDVRPASVVVAATAAASAPLDAGPPALVPAYRRQERTVLRGSGPGATELVRHVFLPDAPAPPASAATPPVSTPVPAPLPNLIPDLMPAEVAGEPPLLDLVNAALDRPKSPPGQVEKDMSLSPDKPRDPGAQGS